MIIKDMALITKTVDLDSRCGFDNTLAAIDDLLDLGSLIDLLFSDPQTVAIDAESCAVGGDCLGTRYLLDGNATVTGTKTVTGLLDILDDDPLHPVDRTSARIQIEQAVLAPRTSSTWCPSTHRPGPVAIVPRPPG